MRRLSLALSTLVPILFVAGCSGNGATPIDERIRSIDGSTRALFPRAGKCCPDAAPPAHAAPAASSPPTTSTERARALAGGWTPVTNTAPWTNGADIGAADDQRYRDGARLLHFKLVCPRAGSKRKLRQRVRGRKRPRCPSGYGPLYFASAVLADGKLIVNGGEYNFCHEDETNLGAIYDPVANTWTSVTGPPGWSQIGDAQSAVLSNGTYMLGNCCSNDQALLDETSMTWTQIGTGKHDPNERRRLDAAA